MFFKKEYTDIELVKACALNDRKAQEHLYARYFDTVWNNTFRHIKDESTTMDIVNTGFLKVFKSIHKFELSGSLEAWIRRIVYNTMIDQIRTDKRKYRFLVLEDYSSNAASHDKDNLIEEDLFKIIDILPEVTKMVFLFFAIEGYSHKEIGEMLEIKESTSRWHLSTAREKLQNYLMSKNEYVGYKRK